MNKSALTVLTLMSVGASGCLAHAAVAADVASSDQIPLEGRFGRVMIDTHSGQLSDLRLRNPGGSLSSQALTGGPIGTSVVGSDGRRYASQYGAPPRVIVHRDRDGHVNTVKLKDVTLGPSPVLTSVPARGQATSVAVSRDGKSAYVTNFADGSITPFDPTTGKAGDAIKLGASPTGLVVAPNGHVFVAACLAPCVSAVKAGGAPIETGRGELIEVDPATGAIVATTAVGKLPQFPAITPDGTSVLVPNYGSDSVSVVDTTNATVRDTIAVGPGPVTVAVAPDGERAYVTNLGSWRATELPRAGDDTVTPIDITTMRSLAPIKVGPSPFGAAVTPDGRRLVISLNRAHALVTVDTATGAVSKPIDVGVFPKGGYPHGLALSPDGSTAYVFTMVRNSSRAGHLVVPVDLVAGRALKPLPLMPADGRADPRLFPNGVAVSPDGKLLFAASWPGQTVERYRLSPDGPGAPDAPLTEDWTLSTDNRDPALHWTIEQHWTAAFSGTDQAEPGLPFTADIVDTLWYSPAKLISRTPSSTTTSRSEDFFQLLDDTHSWAVYKLWSPYRLQSDLRLDVDGGYLTRYVGRWGSSAQAGARLDREDAFQVKAGQTRRLTVGIAASDAHETGYQMDASIPDRSTLAALEDFYESLLNGGVVADQGNYWLGNEVAGSIFAYEALDAGIAMSAGLPGRQPASEHTYTLPAAFRRYLADVLSTVDANGKLQFGFSAAGVDLDTSLDTVLGIYLYTVHTGDLSLFRQYEPTVERMLSFWTARIAPNGLVRTPGAEAEFHDIMNFGTSYYSTYINSLVYESLRRVSELQRAIGDTAAAQSASAYAAQLKEAINRVLWAPDGPHGPMYADWIDEDTGQKSFYFMGSAQYPAIEYGIADRAQAHQILATADARIAELKASAGYRGTGTLVTLWPLPPNVINQELWPFGVYMNGGMLLRETYSEIVARARAGDADGAYNRLAGFAHGFEDTSWWGDNAATIGGQLEGGARDAYLSGMESAPAALIHGILGIEATWDSLRVSPALPHGWRRVEASILYRGKPYCISIHGQQVQKLSGACARDRLR